MGMFIHPQTRQRVVYANHIGDITFLKDGDDAICNEDVPVIGNWSDYTGIGSANSFTQQVFASKENSLQGTDPQVEGKIKLPNLSVVGTREGTHRRRRILEYHEIN
jgi:hypothetical protein